MIAVPYFSNSPFDDILQNHQNGRDTHLRQIKVFTPWKDSASFEKILSGTRLPRYTSVEAAMYATIR